MKLSDLILPKGVFIACSFGVAALWGAQFGVGEIVDIKSVYYEGPCQGIGLAAHEVAEEVRPLLLIEYGPAREQATTEDGAAILAFHSDPAAQMAVKINRNGKVMEIKP